MFQRFSVKTLDGPDKFWETLGHDEFHNHCWLVTHNHVIFQLQAVSKLLNPNTSHPLSCFSLHIICRLFVTKYRITVYAYSGICKASFSGMQYKIHGRTQTVSNVLRETVKRLGYPWCANRPKLTKSESVAVVTCIC